MTSHFEGALYTVLSEYQAAYQQLADSSLDDDVIRDTLEGLRDPVEKKCESLMLLVKNSDALCDAIDREIEALQNRIERKKELAKKIENYVIDAMITVGLKKIEAAEIEFVIRKNPPKIVIDSLQEVPVEFMKTPPLPEPYPDKALIKQHISEGGQVSWAHIERSYRLDYK